MLPLRFPRLWLTLGWLAILFAVVVCLMPMSNLPNPGVSDKTEHFVAYLLLSIWFGGIYPRSRYWLVGIGLFFLGIGIEIAQGAMNLGRQADAADVVANTSGVIAGLILCGFGLGRWVQWLESLVGKVVGKPAVDET